MERNIRIIYSGGFFYDDFDCHQWDEAVANDNAYYSTFTGVELDEIAQEQGQIYVLDHCVKDFY